MYSSVLNLVVVLVLDNLEEILFLTGVLLGLTVFDIIFYTTVGDAIPGG